MSDTTVICLPYAGGSGSAYRNWAGVLPGTHVVPVDYPGRLMRPQERRHTSVDALAAVLFAQVVRDCPAPYALCGASLGALVAFELAHLAEAAGHGPRAVMACACAAPGRPLPHRPISDLDDREFFDAVVTTYGGAASGLLGDQDAQDVVLPALRADIAAFETYPRGPKEPIAADIVAVSGQSDRSLSYGDVAAWSCATTGTARVLSVPGDHFFVESQHDLLLGELTAALHSDVEVTGRRRGSGHT